MKKQGTRNASPRRDHRRLVNEREGCKDRPFLWKPDLWIVIDLRSLDRHELRTEALWSNFVKRYPRFWCGYYWFIEGGLSSLGCCRCWKVVSLVCCGLMFFGAERRNFISEEQILKWFWNKNFIVASGKIEKALSCGIADYVPNIGADSITLIYINCYINLSSVNLFLLPSRSLKE